MIFAVMEVFTEDEIRYFKQLSNDE